MAAFDDHTRRKICRLAFVGVCVLPTMAVVVWASWQQLPWFRMVHENALSRQLGLRVAVAEVRRPRPHRVVYRQVVLSEAETGRKLALLPQLTVASTPDGCIVVAPEVRVSASELKTLCRHIGHRLRTLNAGSLCFAGTDVRGLETPADILARDVRFKLEAAPAKVEVDATFNAGARDHGDEPVTVRIVRDRSPDRPRPRTSLTIHARRNSYCCEWLAPFFPAVRRLGTDCRFRGEVTATSSEGQWNGEVNGELLDLDLTTLMAQEFGHQLTGRADVRHLEARVVAGRLERITGLIQAGPGVIGQPLVDAAINALRGRFHGAGRTPPGAWAYEELAARFLLESAGLFVEGACDVKQPGVLLYGQHGAVVGSNPSRPVSAFALIQILVPRMDMDVVVPATPAAQSLARWLPIPEPRRRVARQRPEP